MRILITGGTGFVGKHIVNRLKSYHDLVLLHRDGTQGSLPSGVEIISGDVTDPASLVGKLEGFDAVIHLVAIIEEHGSATFDSVIRCGTENMVEAAQLAGIPRFIHMSALGAQDNQAYPYHHAKWWAEQAVQASGTNWTIFRPSVIFGEGDGFISVLAKVVRQFPLTPIAGSGRALFQPVQVDDVADCFVRAIEDPGLTGGQIYELGGARPYTYGEMIAIIAQHEGVRRPTVHIPLPVMNAVVGVSSFLPKPMRPPVTAEQLKMLSLDNSTAHSATELLIGRRPVALEDGIDYL